LALRSDLASKRDSITIETKNHSVRILSKKTGNLGKSLKISNLI